MESYEIEYKSEIPKKKNQLKAEIVSFLNADGGTIYLGVDDQGNTLKDKVECYAEWEETLSNWISNAFSSDVRELITVFSNEIPFRIQIKRGPKRPYFYKDGDGFNAKGVYVRVGSTKRVASTDEIIRMIYQSGSHEFEKQPVSEHDLTFHYAAAKFQEKGLEFDQYGLLFVTPDNRFNHAALYISDQNPTVSKFAVFQGLTVDTFLDKREFSGSIMKQLDEVLYYANLSNRKKVVITGKPQREERFDYPVRALREAIVNSFCHRDWTLSGDIKIEVFDDRIRIYSPGSLPDGLTLENIKQGMVAKRNPIIVNALDKADYIENYATGIRRIFADYKGFEKQPDFYISDNGVIVTLFNRNYDVRSDAQNDVQNDVQSDVDKLKPGERQERIIRFIQQNKHLTIQELSVLLGVSKPTVERDLAKLRKDKRIEYIGSSKGGHWSLMN
ncbi:MAG: DeoR family transcriptional regulator [Clostridiales bacterium]|nr:DeoR family transcriptional regulator [Clostridiales bacterium]